MAKYATRPAEHTGLIEGQFVYITHFEIEALMGKQRGGTAPQRQYTSSMMVIGSDFYPSYIKTMDQYIVNNRERIRLKNAMLEQYVRRDERDMTWYELEHSFADMTTDKV